MGKVYKYGDDVNTDVIIPARHMNTSEPSELAKYAMEDIDKDFTKTVQAGDIIVAGKNFGSGSSREHAPVAIKASGIRAVIAKSFARIFYRNAFNIGLPILESSDAYEGIEAGDEVEVDFGKGEIRNLSKGETYTATPFPPFMQKLVEAGGLVGYAKTFQL
jgi:3-isopropylmalate/(R)-2-methylmalate dehydratase small subunit